MQTSLHHRNPERGTLLIVAMLLCAAIGISLASYIQLSGTAVRVSNRAMYNNAAVNLSEQGIEEAMYSVNKMIADSTYTWSGWTHPSTAAWRKWQDVALGQGATAEYRVYVYNYDGTLAPKIVSRAIVTLGGATAAPIEKWIEVQLAKTSKFANGLVARNSIIFNGSNATVDSWNSDPNGNGSLIQPYSAGVRNDEGSVGSISVSTGAVLVKQADVWGYVCTGGSDPTTSVGANGSVLGSDSVSDASWTKATVDPARISTQFSANFDAVTTPADSALASLGNINATVTLPRASDSPNGIGQYAGYYVYDASQIRLVNDVVTISGKVLLRVSGDVDIGGGSGEIAISSGGTLALYTPGTVTMSGKGISNGTDANTSGDLAASELGQPINFQLWGTKTSGTQSIDIKGNGAFSGIVYAPQGSVTIVGNGAVNGSVVANNISLSGNAEFHYDESLANFGGGNPFRVSRWKELTLAADRSAYSSQLTF